jgi:hypothetical protein
VETVVVVVTEPASDKTVVSVVVVPSDVDIDVPVLDDVVVVPSLVTTVWVCDEDS